MAAPSVAFRNLGREFEENAERDARRRLIRGLDAGRQHWNGSVRRDTGFFQHNLTPYHGAPPTEILDRPKGKATYPPPTKAEIATVVAAWRLGEEVGLIDNVSYGRFLAEMTDRHGVDNWIELTREAIREGLIA